ncbi:DUF6191 domain-containing protein [Streptomyces sp.]|uniref:DUF6191 domain-containing protein n=1 Tax=Streptomyces sp. TaxID=1931 RepID=UPI0025E1F4C4|nr:DUF6191 domain-containing protein [Streptomyces sp.]
MAKGRRGPGAGVAGRAARREGRGCSSCSSSWLQAVLHRGFKQLHAALSPGKQNELKERQSAPVLRDDEEEDGAPPKSTVDLPAGTAVIRLPGECRHP